MQEVDTLSEAFLGIRSVLSQPTEEVLLEKDFSMPEKSGLFWRGRLRFVSALEEKHFAVITHNSFAPWQPNYPRLPAANALMAPRKFYCVGRRVATVFTRLQVNAACGNFLPRGLASTE